jgi:S-adenosylmethionine-diacylglycerol 3-amino-3-carboxypropyl transferase
MTKLSKKIFESIHHNHLVYNTCWEDPRCDRALLQLNEQSRVVVITSAGCNALDYLLDQPASVDAVDVNPRQNALLNLKKACFKGNSHADLFELFGMGQHTRMRDFFHGSLHQELTPYEQKYWQKHLHALDGTGRGNSFYYFGSSGKVAFWLCRYLKTDPETARSVRAMFEAKDICEQRLHYYRVEPRLLNRFTAWALNSHLVQSMLGVPASQQKMARQAFEDGMSGYFRHSLRKVFVELPLADNYFWKIYFFGQYDSACCPNYLKKEHFDTLGSQMDKLHTHTTTLSGFLKQNPRQYTHFILLDHQDWLAANDRTALDEEWQLIFQNAAPGAKVLFRSAAFDRHFLPTFVKERLQFDDVSVRQQHHLDRVGTYASVHLGEVA